MGTPVVVVPSGGLPITVSANGIGAPMTIASNGFGLAVTVVASGGLPVIGVSTGPDVTAPIIVSSNTISQPENEVLTHYLMANEAVTWAKVGGADSAKFTLAAGVLTLPAKDYEAPDDADTNRTYVVQVQATDTASNVSTIQTITVTITNVLSEPGPGPVIDMQAASDTGSSSTDNITSVTTPVWTVNLTGTAYVPGDTLKVYDGGVEIASEVVTDPDGVIDLGLSALSSGAHAITMKVYGSGVLSLASNTVTVTIDTTAPTLSSPTGTQTGATTASLSVTTDEGNGTLYGVHSTALPTAAQVKAGQDSTGAASSYAFNQAVSGTGVQSKSATGLVASTTYTIRYAQEDAAGNLSTVASAASFTTIAGSSYTGPGDIASGATHHWGIYAYNTAYATGSNPCMDLVDQAGANSITVNIATSGLVNVAAITAWVSANSVSTIRVAKVYDQVGTMHMVMESLAAAPALTLNAIGSVPAITNPAGGRWLRYSTGGIGPSQPYSLSGVAKRVTGAANFQSAFGGFSDPSMHFWNDNQLILNAGSLVSAPGATTTENVFLTMAAVFNGASSKGAIDSALGSAVNAGANAASGIPYIFHPSYEINGMVMGWTFWPSDKSANFVAIHANNETMLGI